MISSTKKYKVYELCSNIHKLMKNWLFDILASFVIYVWLFFSPMINH